MSRSMRLIILIVLSLVISVCIIGCEKKSDDNDIRKAQFEQPDASVAAIDYHSGRKLNKSLIERMANCEYITEYRNIFITGATGSGKPYMACAFGMEACKQYYTVQYVRLPDMLLEL